jgi:hypothetical protein
MKRGIVVEAIPQHISGNTNLKMRRSGADGVLVRKTYPS